MRLAVFGATGRLGRAVIEAALAAGHSVIAHSRKGHSDTSPGVTWLSGDYGEAVRNVDATVITFGPRSTHDAPFCRAETEKIVHTMGSLGRRRILCVTGAMVGDYPGNRSWCFRQLTRWIQRKHSSLLNDRAEQETVVRGSGLEWTIFKPPRLTMRAPKGLAVVGPAVRVGMLSSISRGDLARLMVREAEQCRFVGQAVFAKA
jgi:putative NADH-flavin reductase